MANSASKTTTGRSGRSQAAKADGAAANTGEDQATLPDPAAQALAETQDPAGEQSGSGAEQAHEIADAEQASEPVDADGAQVATTEAKPWSRERVLSAAGVEITEGRFQHFEIVGALADNTDQAFSVKDIRDLVEAWRSRPVIGDSAPTDAAQEG